MSIPKSKQLLNSIQELKNQLKSDVTDSLRLCDRCDYFEQLFEDNKPLPASILSDLETFLIEVNEYITTCFVENSFLEKVSLSNRTKAYNKLQQLNSRLEQTLQKCNLYLDSDALILRRTEDLQVSTFYEHRLLRKIF
jgi:hypothetical protein